MSNKTKWIIYSAIGVIALLLIVIFSKNIWNWFENALVSILIYVVVFGAGWALGRFGCSRRQDRDAQNARNITQAQK